MEGDSIQFSFWSGAAWSHEGWAGWSLLGDSDAENRIGALSYGRGVFAMENLTPLQHLFLHLLSELSEQQQQDVLRIMQALAMSSK